MDWLGSMLLSAGVAPKLNEIQKNLAKKERKEDFNQHKVNQVRVPVNVMKTE